MVWEECKQVLEHYVVRRGVKQKRARSGIDIFDHTQESSGAQHVAAAEAVNCTEEFGR